MNGKRFQAIASLGFALILILDAAWQARAQDRQLLYPSMAPIEQYLMTDRDAEIALARSAAPESISRDAEVLVLARHGFETAVKGKNGFVCIVGRSWTSAADADFLDPKVRVPMCVNAAAARSYLLRITKIAELALAGHTLAQVNEAIAAAVAHWPSHLMFFYSDIDPAIWGANLPGSPVIAVADPMEHLTQFVIPTQKWSDGTEDLPATPHVH